MTISTKTLDLQAALLRPQAIDSTTLSDLTPYPIGKQFATQKMYAAASHEMYHYDDNNRGTYLIESSANVDITYLITKRSS